MTKLLLSLLIALGVSGCASTRPEFLENRVVCTVDKQEAHIVSKWGPVGVASKIAESDTKVICN